MTDKTLELLNCPHCGGKADYHDDGMKGYAYCTHCLCRTDDYYSWRDKNWKEDAARDWNKSTICNDLKDRDRYHEMADELADAIAKHFGVEIGEHSNMNCPWENALEWIAPSIPVKDSVTGNFLCGQCGEKVENWDYCPNCGQRLWSEE